MKKEIEDRAHLHKNMEQLYDGRLKNLQNQLDAAVTKNTEYDKMVKYLRKKSAADKDALVKVAYEMHSLFFHFIDTKSNIVLLFRQRTSYPNKSKAMRT